MSKIEQLKPALCYLYRACMDQKKRRSKLIVMIAETEPEKKSDAKDDVKEQKFEHINDWKNVKINELRKLK